MTTTGTTRSICTARRRTGSSARRATQAVKRRRTAVWFSAMSHMRSPITARCSSRPSEALLPRDTNGQCDVYEFDYNGGLHLISTGTGTGASVLLDASVSGNDVFFLTPQSLVPQDSFQEAHKIYDARVDGGFPETALPPACTTADACRAAASPQPSIFGEPSSQTFSGAGNLAPSATAIVKPRSPTRAEADASFKKRAAGRRTGQALACEQQARKRYGAKRLARSGPVRQTRQEGRQVSMFSRRIATAVSLAVLAIVAMGTGAAPALAAGEAHPFVTSFGSFANPNGIAIDESTGDVYVADIGTNTVYKFDANGNPVEFSALHSNALNGAARRPVRSPSRPCPTRRRRSRSTTRRARPIPPVATCT